MYAFIRHTPDCREVAERIELSHPDLLVPAADGFMWTAVPTPVSNWTVALVDGTIRIVPFERPLEVRMIMRRSALKQAVKDAVTRLEKGGCFCKPFGLIDTDDKAQGRIAQFAMDAFIAKTSGEEWIEHWKLADGSVATIDADGMLTIRAALREHLSRMHWLKVQADAAIDAATTLDALEAFDVHAGMTRLLEGKTQ